MGSEPGCGSCHEYWSGNLKPDSDMVIITWCFFSLYVLANIVVSVFKNAPHQLRYLVPRRWRCLGRWCSLARGNSPLAVTLRVNSLALLLSLSWFVDADVFWLLLPCLLLAAILATTMNSSYSSGAMGQNQSFSFDELPWSRCLTTETEK